MIGYFFQRLWQAALVLLAAYTITFVFVRLAEGGPFDDEKSMPEPSKAALMAYYGLDKGPVEQYFHGLSNIVLRGDFGPSYHYEGQTVNGIIANAFPISLIVGGGAFVIALLIGLPLGSIAALRKNSGTDYAASGLAMVGICLPSFVLGPILALVFGLKLNWFNAAGWYDASDWFLPSLTLGLFYAAYIARLSRAGMLEVLSQDFIRTARAKGLEEKRVVVRHALRGALQPVVAFLGPAFAGLITGSIVIEKVFQIPGLGQHFVSAATNRDYPLAQGTVVFYAALIVGLNFVVDMIQAWMDPRVRLGDDS